MKIRKIFMSVVDELFRFLNCFFEGFLPRTSFQWFILWIWSCFIVGGFTFNITCLSAFEFFEFDLTSWDQLLMLCRLLLYFVYFFIPFVTFGLFNWISERFNIRCLKRKDFKK